MSKPSKSIENMTDEEVCDELRYWVNFFRNDPMNYEYESDERDSKEAGKERPSEIQAR